MLAAAVGETATPADVSHTNCPCYAELGGLSTRATESLERNANAVGEVRRGAARGGVPVPALEVPSFARVGGNEAEGLGNHGQVQVQRDSAGVTGELDLTSAHVAANVTDDAEVA